MNESEFQRRRIKALSAPKGRKRAAIKQLLRARTRMLKKELGR